MKPQKVKHKRKDKWVGYGRFWRTVPKEWVRFYHKKDRTRTKKALLRELEGLDGIFPLNPRHSATWDWW